MPKMDEQTFRDFVDGARIAHLVTLQADGSPHVAPVWYEHMGGQFLVFTPGTSLKLVNIRRDSRVVISIAGESEPYHYVTVEGAAELASGDVAEQAESIAKRYRGAKAKDFIASLDDLHLITITPTKLTTYVGT